MKTADLIKTLAADTTPPRRPYWQKALVLVVAAGFTLGFLLLGLGVRQDILAELGSWRFLAKFVVTGTLILLAWRAIGNNVNPANKSASVVAVFGGAAALLLAFAVAEMALLPPAEWTANAVGGNGLHCLKTIPVLAAAPLAALLWVLRDGAPQSPALAGGAAGALAAAFGAFLYAAHCPDDSPLFLAVWYVIAIAVTSAIGAFAGRRVLAW